MVEAMGRNLEYQWFSARDGDDIVLANTDQSLVIVNITKASHDGASFYVEVINNAGVVVSNTVTLTIG